MSNKCSSPVVLKQLINDFYKIRPLPDATGKHPYRLDIEEILREKVDSIQDEMKFHMVGDTGSARHSDFQQLLADVLSDDTKGSAHASSFLYHLGDVVYNFGEASGYPSQFLKPYEQYDAPIFAIAGNHDGDINPLSAVPYQSLDAFMDVFCDCYPRLIGFSKGSRRLTMVQPNVYWTLNTPLIRFIGLYSNVTKHGYIDDRQREWLINELHAYKRDSASQALLLCVHHAPYSADTNHGSSLAMIELLDQAFELADVLPTAVVSGHVHNYQRFSKQYGAVEVPFIVAGAGGYADLHTVATVDNTDVGLLIQPDRPVVLENFCDDSFGFLKWHAERKGTGVVLIAEYYRLSGKPVYGKLDVDLFDRVTIFSDRTAEVGL